MKKEDLEKLIKKRDQQLQEAMSHIADLEDALDELENSDMGVVFSDVEKTMVEIIIREIGRLNKDSTDYKLDKDEIKKFDTLVKDFVAIRGKLPKTKKKEAVEEEKELAELLELATS